MNVLLTSVGRRAYLVKYFKEVLGDNGKVFVCNSDEISIAFKYADSSVVSPLIYDKNYIPFLLNFCRVNAIDILVSLFDIDLLMLARHKKEFSKIGTKLIISEPEIIEICNDKWKTYKFLRENGFYTPLSFLNEDEVIDAILKGTMKYPVIVKPRYGCGSISVELAYNDEDLRYLTKKIIFNISNSYLRYESNSASQKVIYQELLKGQEYGADIINDLQGNIQSVIIRKKLAMRSGETDVAQLVDEPVIESSLFELGMLTHHIANMDCDIFLVDGVPYVLEMNARFGGGYPFSHVAGCNLPKAIVHWVQGKEVDKSMISAMTGVTAYKEIFITTSDIMKKN